MSDKLMKPTAPGVVALPNGGTFLMPEALQEVLLRQGIAPTVVRAADVVHHSKVAWDELCYLNTRDRKTMASPVCVITRIEANPDAPPEFEGYRGMARVEFSTELGSTLFITHAMTYAATGENLPLWQWLKGQEPPVLARFGYIETRQAERHVVRILPHDIEIV